MAIVHFDSSAFVKLLVDEDGTELAVWDRGLHAGATAEGLATAPATM